MMRIAARLMVTGMVAVLVLAGCGRQDDVTLARQVVTDLTRGRYAVRKLIDWPNFVAFEKSIGEEYKSLPNNEEKQNYERAFIDSFKKGFREQKGSMNAFTGWRMFSQKDPNLNVVAADLAGGKIVFFVAVKSERGKRKVVELKLMQVLDAQKFEEYEKEMSQ
ncbi:MAG: hypothetical protein PHH75_04625 [Candidatus Omnitrophica bacterium]|nr:hypothetical protein [Candidatus Omnitrophota bacterium]MDD5574445.1 hypothetical protein [Candidatus Omnitrophota bacterium]